jgi:hypothetical protein
MGLLSTTLYRFQSLIDCQLFAMEAIGQPAIIYLSWSEIGNLKADRSTDFSRTIWRAMLTRVADLKTAGRNIKGVVIFGGYGDYPVGAAQSGSSNTITLSATGNYSSSVDDFYNGQTLTTVSGTGSSPAQTRTISDYDGTTKVATVSVAWVTPPDNTTVYRINMTGYVTWSEILDRPYLDDVEEILGDF